MARTRTPGEKLTCSTWSLVGASVTTSPLRSLTRIDHVQLVISHIDCQSVRDVIVLGSEQIVIQVCSITYPRA